MSLPVVDASRSIRSTQQVARPNVGSSAAAGASRVEQIGAEEFTVGPDTELFQAPVRTVTWFHTGAWLEKERLERELAKEYFGLYSFSRTPSCLLA